MRDPCCNPRDHFPVGRRELLKLGSLSLVGTRLSDVLRLQADAVETPSDLPATAKSIVFVYQSGGPSQHETFDPKPDAPDTIRGEYGTCQTRLPGIQFCEYLPRLAARADRFSIVRTMRQHYNSCHGGCNYLLHTGTTELPRGETNASITRNQIGGHAWPSIGSMIAYSKGPRGDSGLPPVIEIPRLNRMNYPGREGGLLGARYDRVGIDLAAPCHAPDAGGSCPNCYSHDDPNLDAERRPGPGPRAWWDNTSCREPDFHLPNPGDVSIPSDVLRQRNGLRKTLEGLGRRIDAADRSGQLAKWDLFRGQALQFILASRRPGKANPFDLAQESATMRDRYGREEWGQAFLVARRLVEAGVRMVQVTLRGWDTHQNAFRDLKAKALPSLDYCLSGFLDDLEERGLLDETLVVMCGEMGRTPKVQPISPNGKNASGERFTPGRDHWGHVFPCLFAGGGIQPGRVLGSTDYAAGAPVTEAYTPSDLAATIFHCLGIGPDREFQDDAGRPYRIYRGHPIGGLL
ncbi:MAG: hypothetical protein CMJ70_17830 [Planctomycetaceae bacterium]|nr:hypothetical protein [Planctomycetaceae bacterium]